MLASNVAEVESVIVAGRSVGPHYARPALASTLGTSTRATLEIIGLLSVVIFITLAAMPDLRAPVFRFSTGIWAAVCDSLSSESAGDDEDGVDEDAPARPGQQAALTAADLRVATYLARRYHVADRAVRVMVGAARGAGKEYQIDPMLILAVIAVESSMNPYAQSPVGATGLMQVMPDVHGEKFQDHNPDAGALDPVANIRVGSEILSDVIHRGGSVERGLQLYVGAGNLADDGGYGNRVLGELGRLQMAASGNITGALAAGARADGRLPAAGPEPLNTSASGPAAQARKPTTT